MAENQGITLIKSFDYRGDSTEEFSNTYHFTGALPASDAGWKSLADALIALEAEVLFDDVKYQRAYGYAHTDEPTVYVYDNIQDVGPVIHGQLASTGVPFAPGDAACWARWKTSRVNSKGKPIYLRKYFHHVGVAGGTDGYDQVNSAQKTALETFAAAVEDVSGAWPGLAGPAGDETFLSESASTYITTRTLKRRGRRPS